VYLSFPSDFKIKFNYDIENTSMVSSIPRNKNTTSADFASLIAFSKPDLF